MATDGCGQRAFEEQLCVLVDIRGGIRRLHMGQTQYLSERLLRSLACVRMRLDGRYSYSRLRYDVKGDVSSGRRSRAVDAPVNVKSPSRRSKANPSTSASR